MTVKYVYPFVFTWDRIVPTNYPFIKPKGPGEGVLLVFNTREEYDVFSNGDGRQPIVIQEEYRDGQSKNG